MREFQLIENFFKPLTNLHKAARELADDVANISLKDDEELVISKDMFVEDVHFLLKDGGFKIASKLLRTNLSDLAAAGAKPIHYMLGFSKNDNMEENFYSEFARGLKSVQDEFDLCLIGGDTVKSKQIFFSVTIFGVVKKSQILSRNQAKAGDLIFVSGNIGDAFLGRLTEFDEYLVKRHFFPTPRIDLGKFLIEKNLAKCAIDISDGLLADLNHICEASKLNAAIFLNKIPLSASAQKFFETNSKIKLTNLVSGGDDYELIFAVNPKNKIKILELEKSLNLKLSCIGEFKESQNKNYSASLFDEKNNKITTDKSGYEH